MLNILLQEDSTVLFSIPVNNIIENNIEVINPTEHIISRATLTIIPFEFFSAIHLNRFQLTVWLFPRRLKQIEDRCLIFHY